MSNTTSTKKSNKSQDLFIEIINDFIQKLEKGINPFEFGRNVPLSLSTGNPYRNLNRLILSYYGALNGFRSAKWATIKQINKAKGRVLKDSKSTPIFFFEKSWVVEVTKNGEAATVWSHEESKTDAMAYAKGRKGVTAVHDAKQRTTLKHFTVFNLDQTTLVDEDIVDKAERVAEQPLVLKTAVMQKIEHKEAKHAKYEHKEDCIYCEEGESLLFDYNGYFKAVVQATGHESRLDREVEYVEEELIKLIGSSYLLGLTGLEQSPVAPQLAAIFVEKLKTSPNSIWKYARLADDAYGMVAEWIKVETASRAS